MEYNEKGIPQIEATSVECGVRKIDGSTFDTLEFIRRELLCNDLKDLSVSGTLLIQSDYKNVVRVLDINIGSHAENRGIATVDKVTCPTKEDGNDVYHHLSSRNGIVFYDEEYKDGSPYVTVHNGFSDYAQEIVRLVGNDLKYTEGKLNK